MKMRHLFVTFMAMMLSVAAVDVSASETNGTINSSYKFAWGENLGWVNMAPQTGGGLSITDSAVTGYAWTSAAGWLNFSADGVTNTSEGVLGGSAWSSQKGWIDFTGVTINSSGVFTGTAGTEGSTAGRISFDCDNCEVRTDWRPASARTSDDDDSIVSSGSSGGGSSNEADQTTPDTAATNENNNDAQPSLSSEPYLDAPDPNNDPIGDFYRELDKYEPSARWLDNHVESFGAPLTVEPDQNGLLIWDFSTGAQIESQERIAVIVEVPKGAYGGRIIVSASLVGPDDAVVSENTDGHRVYVINDAIFDITATDEDGKLVHNFKEPLTITLVVPELLRGRDDLRVYWSSEEVDEWTLVEDVRFDDKTATFDVDHLTLFAIMAVAEMGDNTTVSTLSDSLKPSRFWLLALIPAFWFFIRRRHNKRTQG